MKRDFYLDMLIKMIKGGLKLSKEYYYRLVLVSTSHKYKLPNYVVYSEEDVEKVKDFVSNCNGYSEIWLFNEKKQKGRLDHT